MIDGLTCGLVGLPAYADVSTTDHLQLPDGREAPDIGCKSWRECIKQVPIAPAGPCRNRLRRADKELLQQYPFGEQLRLSWSIGWKATVRREPLASGHASIRWRMPSPSRNQPCHW